MTMPQTHAQKPKTQDRRPKTEDPRPKLRPATNARPAAPERSPHSAPGSASPPAPSLLRWPQPAPASTPRLRTSLSSCSTASALLPERQPQKVDEPIAHHTKLFL